MLAKDKQGTESVYPPSIIFPAALLIVTPISDIVRAITFNIAWGHVGFWCAFVGVALALVTFLPMLIDWLALDEGTRARRIQAPSLVLQGGGILAFIASIVLRMHAGMAHLAPLAFVFADLGVTALGAAALISGDGYRPAPVRLRAHSHARPRRLSHSMK